jgi:hypothetical protein
MSKSATALQIITHPKEPYALLEQIRGFLAPLGKVLERLRFFLHSLLEFLNFAAILFVPCEVLLLALNATIMHYPASRALKQARRRTVITGNAARGAVRFAKPAIRALVNSHALLHRFGAATVL